VTARDLADVLNLDENLITEARLASRSYSSLSLWAPMPDDTMLADHILVYEDGFERVDNTQTVRQVLAKLPPRARAIVRLRFRDGLSQLQIASIVGLSQMHVSRILRDAVISLRRLMSSDDGIPAQHGAAPALPIGRSPSVHSGRPRLAPAHPEERTRPAVPRSHTRISPTSPA
jgi:RNA polymerase sigma-B factor